MMCILRSLATVIVLYLLVVAGLCVAYRVVNPSSAFMVESVLTGHGARRHWVPLSHISAPMVRTLLVSEDARFCQHHGIDWYAVDKAIDQADRRRNGPRGASTITMQVVKNLFFWDGRSYVRKALEAPLALWLDFVLPKRRILEIYLNVAQWGNGIFGIDAAARHYFGIPASALDGRQAAMLVTMLPDPTRRDAAHPGFGLLRLSWKLEARLAAEGADVSCLRQRR